MTPYWPKALGERVTLGPFVVTLEGEEVSAEYTTRTMSLEHQVRKVFTCCELTFGNRQWIQCFKISE